MKKRWSHLRECTRKVARQPLTEIACWRMIQSHQKVSLRSLRFTRYNWQSRMNLSRRRETKHKCYNSIRLPSAKTWPKVLISRLKGNDTQSLGHLNNMIGTTWLILQAPSKISLQRTSIHSPKTASSTDWGLKEFLRTLKRITLVHWCTESVSPPISIQV